MNNLKSLKSFEISKENQKNHLLNGGTDKGEVHVRICSESLIAYTEEWVQCMKDFGHVAN